MKDKFLILAGVLVLSHAQERLFADNTNKEVQDLGTSDANIKLKKNSNLMVETASGFFVNISSTDKEDRISISKGLNSVSTVFAPVDGKIRVSRYIQDGESETWIIDKNGDGFPDDTLEWIDGKIVKVQKIEVRFTEIKPDPVVSGDK